MSAGVAHVYALPGTQCDARLWQWLQPALTAVRWHPVPLPAANTLDQMIDSLAEELPEQAVNLFGFSLGGYLAAALASRYPARVASLFICSNSPTALPESEMQQRRQLLAWIHKHGYPGLSERKIRQMISPVAARNAAIGETMKAMDATLGASVLVQQLTATSERADLAEPLAKLGLPIQFCFGDSDALINKPWVRNFCAHHANAQWTEIPGVGHMLPLEAPAALAQEVQRWLAGCAG